MGKNIDNGGLLDKLNISDMINNIKHIFADLLGKESDRLKIEQSAKTDLMKLEDNILGLDKNNIGDGKLDETEGKFDDLNNETTLLGLLYKNDDNIKNWFDWVKDVEDKNSNNILLRDVVIDYILGVLRNESDDNNNGIGDLRKRELKEIGEKLKICKDIFDDSTLYGDGKIPLELKGKPGIKGKILEAFLNATSGSNNIEPEDIKNKIIAYLKNIKPEDLETPTPETQEETPPEEPTGDEIETPEEPEGENPQN